MTDEEPDSPKQTSLADILGNLPAVKAAKKVNTLSRVHQRLIAQPDEGDEQRLAFQHTVFCQTSLPYRNPGDDVRKWEREQGAIALRVEAGTARHPKTGKWVELGLPWGTKPRLILAHLNAEALAMLRAQLSSSGDAPADRAMPDLAAAAKRLIRVVPTLDESTARHLAERGTERRADGLHWRWDRRLRSPAGVGVASGLGDPLRYLTTGYTLVFGRDGDLHGARDWRALCNEYLSGIIELPGGHNLHFDVPEALSRIVTA
jgi:hypothetical protein